MPQSSSKARPVQTKKKRKKRQQEKVKIVWKIVRKENGNLCSSCKCKYKKWCVAKCAFLLPLCVISECVSQWAWPLALTLATSTYVDQRAPAHCKFNAPAALPCCNHINNAQMCWALSTKLPSCGLVRRLIGIPNAALTFHCCHSQSKSLGTH